MHRHRQDVGTRADEFPRPVVALQQESPATSVTFSATISICGGASSSRHRGCAEATHQSCRLIHKIVEIPGARQESSVPYTPIKETKEEKALRKYHKATESKSIVQLNIRHYGVVAPSMPWNQQDL
jgi:hypothetical protein